MVSFGKTDVINPVENTTITMEAERYMLASYDEKAAKGYIISAGDYYLAIGDSSHDAHSLYVILIFTYQINTSIIQFT